MLSFLCYNEAFKYKWRRLYLQLVQEVHIRRNILLNHIPYQWAKSVGITSYPDLLPPTKRILIGRPKKKIRLQE